MSLLGVIAFHFPALLTSQQFRAAYTEGFARTLVLIGLVAAFALGTFAILTGRDRRIAFTGVLSAALLARLYAVAEADVLFTPYDTASTFKATLPRLIPAGDIGDTDVYGCQQHAPLLDVEIPVNIPVRR